MSWTGKKLHLDEKYLTPERKGKLEKKREKTIKTDLISALKF